MRRAIVLCCSVLAAAVPSLSMRTLTPLANVRNQMRNTPLLVARQYLLLARSRVEERCYSDAVPSLLTTAEALTYFAERQIGRSPGFGASAGDIRQQILDYVRSIEVDNGNALSNVDRWLEQIRQWNTPPGLVYRLNSRSQASRAANSRSKLNQKKKANNNHFASAFESLNNL
jgi:hypothetical protein